MTSLTRKLGACVVVLLCIILYARSHFYRDPGSAFFDRRRAYEEKYSRHRRAETYRLIDWFSSPSTAQQRLTKASEDASLCVALTSVKRGEMQYLETTIASLLHGLTPQERADLYLSVFIAETEPERHPSWHSEWVHEAADEVFSYNVSTSDQENLRDWEESNAYKYKGVFDYAYALERCYAAGTPYIGMFEDDIMLADGWLVRTLLQLQSISKPYMKETSWLFMRLFNQERSTGWAHKHIGGNHEHWIIFGVALGITIPALILRACSRSARAHLDLGTLLIVVLLLNPALVVLFYQCGKASLLPPSPGVFAENFGCCSQAMIFPRAQIPGLVDFLREQEEGQVDMLLKRRARTADLTRYSMYPVQAQHIGIDSARQTDKEEAQAIWSMAYEDLDPDKLDRAHLRMVDEYYGRGSSGSVQQDAEPYAH